MALTDYSIDTSGSPLDVQRRQALADALMKQGMDSTPAAGGRGGGWVTALNRGLAGALGGYQRGLADQEAKEGRASADALFASLSGMGPSPTSGAVADVAPTSPPSPTRTVASAAPDTSTKIYENNEPSPLDPPSGEDRRKMLATILGEEDTAAGRAGVANVIRNRAVDGGYGGNTPSSVVTAKGQFEPWGTEAGRARMERAMQDPAQVAAADKAIASAYGEGGRAPEDPTEGKTMFYSPTAQAALGRPAPSWAQGPGQMLGKTAFYDDNSETPANSVPTQGALPTQPQATAPVQSAPARPGLSSDGSAAWAMAVVNNPYSTPAQKSVAAAVLSKSMTPKDVYTQEVDKDGNVWSVNRTTGQRTVALQAKENQPASVKEYEYYTKNFKPTPEQPAPMPYDTWSTAKARASASSVTTNIDTKGPDKYDTVMGEGLAKSHSSLSNGVEDAQARARDLAAMQGAVDAIQKNGGTTGGMGQAQALEVKKTINAGLNAMGIEKPFDEKDLSDKEFLTKFNRQIAGAQAKSAVGSRVTNFEMSNYLKANPGLEMSLTGNQRLIGIQSQIEQRNIAVGNEIRKATAEAVGAGQRINPAKIEKIIRDYDEAHHVIDPVTGQDLTQSYVLPEFQKADQGTNSGLAAGHEKNMQKIRVWDPATGQLK